MSCPFQAWNSDHLVSSNKLTFALHDQLISILKFPHHMTQQRYNIRCDTAGQDILAGTSHALTELINTVAPPISEHEVVQVWMTHRMKGYDGVESVVYQGVMKVGLTRGCIHDRRFSAKGTQS